LLITIALLINKSFVKNVNAKNKVLSISAILIIIAASAVVIYLTLPSAPPANSEKMRVVTSFFPMYDFSRNVGGDKVEVSSLVPVGVEVHDWEPKTGDIQKVLSADVFVYNGLGVEPWIDSMKEAASSSQVVFIDTSEGLDAELLTYIEGGTDPHIWLDPVIAKHQVDKILEGFKQADHGNADYFETNARQYQAKLDELDTEIRGTLDAYTRREFISFHEAFSYFAKRYNLTQIYLLPRGQEEPSPSDVAMVIETAKAKNITVIYAEPLSDPSLAEEVASQIPNGRVLILDPAEEVPLADIEAGKDYLSIMKQNVKNLEEGLK
jgi:zinc transport system substrate-binding protein